MGINHFNQSMVNQSLLGHQFNQSMDNQSIQFNHSIQFNLGINLGINSINHLGINSINLGINSFNLGINLGINSINMGINSTSIQSINQFNQSAWASTQPITSINGQSIASMGSNHFNQSMVNQSRQFLGIFSINQVNQSMQSNSTVSSINPIQQLAQSINPT